MKLINTLDRYVFFESLPPFFASVSFCLVVFTMRHLLIISDMIVNQGIGLISLCLLLIYAIPYFIQYIVPISVVISVLTVCLKMSESNEITALKLSGMSVFTLLKPVSLFAIGAVIITGITTIFILPTSEKLFRSVTRDILTSSVSICLREKTFNDRFENITIYVERIDRENKEIYDVFIDNSSNKTIKNTIVAPRGKLKIIQNKKIICLELFEGFIFSTDLSNLSIQQLRFDTYRINLDIKDILPKEQAWNKTIKEMTSAELKSLLNSNSIKNGKYYKVFTQYHKKFSIPISCLAMSILALSLGIKSRRFNKSTSVILSIILFLGYYLMFSVCVMLSESGFCSSAVWVYFPNILCGFIGLYLLSLDGKTFFC